MTGILEKREERSGRKNVDGGRGVGGDCSKFKVQRSKLNRGKALV
jgi:hypothetical protein